MGMPMSDNDQQKLSEIPGSRLVKDEEIREYKRIMEEEVIPEIAATVEKRRLAAAKSRLKQLKC